MNDSSPERSRSTRLLAPVLLIVVALLVIQSARVLSAVSQLENDARALKTLADQDTTSLDAVFASDDLGALMAQTEEDLRAVRAVFGPLVNVAPWLGWLPRYGGDLANAPALLDFGESVAAGAQKTLSVAHTFNAAFEAGRAANAPLGATLLQSAQAQTPTILAAQTDLAQALQARARVDVAQLSPSLRDLMNRVDRWLPLWKTSLDALALAPTLLGADKPRTYLLIAQNNDELRATGGFVSSVALVRVERGKITVADFQDSFGVDDLTKSHPTPPEPLYRYMYAWQWLFRDANWSPDFQTTARQLQTLYQFDRGIATDGVIAINQNILPRVMQATGPITLNTYNENVDATNVISKIHAYWVSPWEQGQPADWWVRRKDFIGTLLQALMQKLLAGQFDRTQLARGLLDATTTKDLLVYVNGNDPSNQSAFTFGGALYRGAGDALMIVDSNIGFNKVDANVTRQLDYAVTINPAREVSASVAMTYTNRSPDDGAFCVHVPRYMAGYADLQNGCYWDYTRVVVPEASEPLRVKGLPEPVKDVPESGRAVFAGYFVLPRGKSQTVRFDYRLPPTALTGSRYTLHLEKQPGVSPIPATVRVTLPESWMIVYAYPTPDLLAGNRAEFSLTLDHDREIEVDLETPGSSTPTSALVIGLGAAALVILALALGYRRRATARSR